MIARNSSIDDIVDLDTTAELQAAEEAAIARRQSSNF